VASAEWCSAHGVRGHADVSDGQCDLPYRARTARPHLGGCGLLVARRVNRRIDKLLSLDTTTLAKLRVSEMAKE
jgi:hypothetical protein